MLTFPSCFICFDSVSCSSLPRITLADASHACGWHMGSKKERKITKGKYSTLLLALPIAGCHQAPKSFEPLPLIEVFFYVTNSSLYSVRLPLPSVVCAFAFYNSSKERVFLLLKGGLEVKVMVRCLKTSTKLLWRQTARNTSLSPPLMLLHCARVLQKCCRLVCYFSTALMRNVIVIPSREEYFGDVSILKNGEVI